MSDNLTADQRAQLREQAHYLKTYVATWADKMLGILGDTVSTMHGESSKGLVLHCWDGDVAIPDEWLGEFADRYGVPQRVIEGEMRSLCEWTHGEGGRKRIAATKRKKENARLFLLNNLTRKDNDGKFDDHKGRTYRLMKVPE